MTDPGGVPAALPMQDLAVDAFYLANSCEVQSGLLYVMGGGWMRCWPDTGVSYPFERPIGVVALLRVPYNRTDEEHSFVIAVRDSDERELTKAEGSFRVGRDAWLTSGMSQLVPIALLLRARIEKTGIYHTVIQLNGIERNRIEFEALPKKPGT